MKIDWDAVDKDIRRFFQTRDTVIGLWRYEEILARHTSRTEEDLPESGVYLVRFPGHAWFIARFNRRRIVGLALYFGDNISDSTYAHINDRLLDLEIGPEILPPGGCHE